MEPLIYEIEHSTGVGHFMLYERENHCFPLHMHRCFELVLVLDGEMNMRIENREYALTAGNLVLIKPNRLHSYDTPVDRCGTCLICVFSGDLVAASAEPLTKHRLVSPIVSNVPPLLRDMFIGMRADRSIAAIKGFLYTACDLFYGLLELDREDDIAKDTLLLHDILLYLEQNLTEPCMLKDVSAAFGYHPVYLSRYFKKAVGMSYYSYVQSIKIDRACYLLTNTSDSILSVSIQCGYTTLSSFNRAFRLLTGKTPKEYRSNA